MKLEKWALVAEVGSALAVVVTLGVLIAGIRDGTRSTQAATYQALMTDINRVDFVLLEDPKLVSILFPDSRWTLEGEETQAALVTRILSRSMESAYFAHRNGTLDEQQWERFHRNICIVRSFRGPEFWETIEIILTNEFVAYLEESCPRSDAG